MKLCFIATQAGEYGGSEVLWYMTAKEALIKGIKVLISAHNSYLAHSQLQELIRMGAELHVRQDADLKNAKDKIFYKLRCYLPWLNLFTEIKRFKPDLVVVSQRGTYDAASQLMLYKFLIRRISPYVLISQFHAENKVEMHPDVRKRARKLFNNAKRFYFVSKRNKIASEASIGGKIRSAYVINNPIKLQVDEIDWPITNNFNIACVARINFTIKRQHLLLNVLAQEKWKERNLRLNLYGDGPDAVELKLLIQQKNLASSVSMFGQVEDIKQIWEHNHLFILPSVAEGLPLALIEANLFGRAAITTNVGDNERLVLQDYTGFLVNDLSEQALDNALEEAWEKRNLWEHLGNNARMHALRNLDTNIHKTLLSQIIEFANE